MTPATTTEPSGTPPPAKRPYLRSDDRRQQLLDVAQTIVERVGLAQLTISQLAVEAGVTRQTAYHHFADINELFREILRARFGAMQDEINLALEEFGHDFERAIRHAVIVGIDLPRRDRLMLRYVFGGLEADRPELRDTLHLLRGLITLRWCRALYGEQIVSPRTRAAVWAVVNAVLSMYDLLDAGEITRADAIEVVVSQAMNLPRALTTN